MVQKSMSLMSANNKSCVILMQMFEIINFIFQNFILPFTWKYPFKKITLKWCHWSMISMWIIPAPSVLWRNTNWKCYYLILEYCLKMLKYFVIFINSILFGHILTITYILKFILKIKVNLICTIRLQIESIPLIFLGDFCSSGIPTWKKITCTLSSSETDSGGSCRKDCHGRFS